MDNDLIQSFLEESWENLSQLDIDIVAFEKETSNDELLAGVFRTIHTIKGTCGFIGLDRIGLVAHAAENVLGKMRDRSIDRSPAAITHILHAVDALKELLQGLEQTGSEPSLDHTGLIAQLDTIANGAHPVASSPQTLTKGDLPSPENQIEDSTPGATLNLSSQEMFTESGEVNFEAIDQAIEEAAERHRRQRQQSLASADQRQFTESRGKNGTTTPAFAEASLAPHPNDSANSADRKSVSELSIRVNVSVLDELMNLVGELVLARNQLLQMSRGEEASQYAAPLAHLNRITTDLQEGVMKTRMQPIGNAWSKLPRLIRDLSQVMDKSIELEMTGADTELDRTVLDAIRDPLTHMVRNSADHGLESTAERLRVGKPETGRIRLHAYHEGGHVHIRIEDDGAGINTEKVRTKIVSQGLLPEHEADRLTEREVHQYIFRAGFSTAEQVSSVSGRGVGMDVVRTAIERIGGTIDLQSSRGKGTIIHIKIPLTLAIVSALVVESGGQSFAIPQLGIVELVLLPAEERHRLEWVHDKLVLRLRQQLLPLVRLSEVLQMEPTHGESHLLEFPARQPADRHVLESLRTRSLSLEQQPSPLPSPELSSQHAEADTLEKLHQENVHIVVVQVGEEHLGLLVDRVFDTEEIVVKPVGTLLKEIPIYQGTTILGDGRVIMILDVAGIASEFGTLNTSPHDREAVFDVEELSDGSITSLLVFDADSSLTMAVPLSLVSRLEEFPVDAIERNSDGLVVQYRNSLLPLLSIDGTTASESRAVQPVIVFTDGQQSLGLMVSAIRDVVEERLAIPVQSKRPGLLGTAIVNGRATEVINTQHYLLKANPDWFRNSEPRHFRVLAVNSSPFFQQLLVTALRAEHHTAVAVAAPEEALQRLERDRTFDVILVDFDPSDTEAAEFTSWLRNQTESSRMAIIGLCSRKTPALEHAACQAGCHALLEKFDMAELSQEMERHSGSQHWNQEASA